MKYSNKIVANATAALIGLGVAGGAFAAELVGQQENEKAETVALLSAKLTVADAAKAAETETGGKAVEVNIEDEKGIVIYEVETLKTDGTEFKVIINAMDGKIIKVAKANDEDSDIEDGEKHEHNEKDEG
ncbi:MAG: PepSY domain-containing protein [Rhodomicrobiaceae bacterium]